ncbi:hypothetical protein ABRP87_06160 [Corynebacterium sp. KPL2830]|uniref:hypothetical protein n=1 Tax=unclassified Corynebacterium TaxID=2624378 RepID=UPI0032EF1E26
MNNDFAEFAQGFRERTARRMLEFEKSLAKAQDELEKSTAKAVQQAKNEQHGGRDGNAVGHRQAAAGTWRRGGRSGQNAAAPTRVNNASGQVKSVLRRG